MYVINSEKSIHRTWGTKMCCRAPVRWKPLSLFLVVHMLHTGGGWQMAGGKNATHQTVVGGEGGAGGTAQIQFLDAQFSLPRTGRGAGMGRRYYGRKRVCVAQREGVG